MTVGEIVLGVSCTASLSKLMCYLLHTFFPTFSKCAFYLKHLGHVPVSKRRTEHLFRIKNERSEEDQSVLNSNIYPN